MPAQEKAYERRLVPVQSPVTAPYTFRATIRTQEISKPCTWFLLAESHSPGARSESRLPFKALPPGGVKGSVTSCCCCHQRIPNGSPFFEPCAAGGGSLSWVSLEFQIQRELDTPWNVALTRNVSKAS